MPGPLRLSLAAALVLLSACPPPAGEVVFRLPDGTKTKDATFDFGARAVPTTRTVYLVNPSKQGVDLADVSLTGAFATSLAATTLAPGGELSLPVLYTPAGDDGATLTITSPKGTTLATLALSGHFEGAGCALPDVVDFGVVLVGESVTRTVSFPLQDARRDVFVGAPGSPFVFPTGAPSGTQSVGAGEAFTARLLLPARSTPGKVSATWRLDAGGGCPSKDVTVRAEAREHFLTASPTTVDFGTASAPAQPSASATLVNALTRTVTVTLELQSAAGGVTTNFTSGLTRVELPAAVVEANGDVTGGTAQVPLTAWLLGAGTVQGKLVATTDGANGANEVLEVPLIARAAGAGLAVRPSPVALQVPVVGGQVLPVATGLLVTNENPAMGAPTVTVSAVTIEAAQGTTASELCVGAWEPMTKVCTPPSSFQVAPGAQKQLPLRIEPTGAGPWRWTLVFATDDALVPELRIDVSATARPQGDCVLQQPQSLRFGPVRAPTPMLQALVLENQSLTPCFVQGLWIDGATDVHAPSDFTVNPGERKVVDVEYSPESAPGTTAQPNLRYSVNTLTSPVRSIPVDLASDDGCLFVFPEQFDFGTVGPSCGAREQSFGVGNRCAMGDVSFNSVRLGGTGPFTFTGQASLRLTPNSVVPDAIRVRFDPTVEGATVGTLEFDVAVGAGTRALIVPLRGVGANTGRQRDRFSIPSSADALFVQDATSSMAPLWQGLGAQAQGFIDAAETRARAVRMAALDADLAGAGALRDLGGRRWVELELSPLQPLGDLLSPPASSAAAEGSRDPVLRALTGAQITSTNHGFLRRAASLNVVVASDARDQSVTPVAVALPQLAALKGSRFPERFTWSHIGPLAATAPSGCTYDDPVMNAGDEVAAVSMTGGVSFEVCSAKASPALLTTQVVPTLFGDRDALPLRAPIAPGTLPVVTVGGVGVPELSSGGGRNWSYDVTRRSVVFSGLTLRTGEVVELDYQTLCPP
ncbi:MAG: hypothetical protein U0228_26710 [Myxococcaceae bacterium]